MQFQPKTILTLRPSPNGHGIWRLMRGENMGSFKGLYRTFQAAYTTAMMADKAQIYKIEITVFRKK